MISSISNLAPETARGLKGVFFDIDDTFTSSGRIPAAAFKALWNLKEAGLTVVPVTGRPAGWCDHIARMWPVDGVIGENGAFYFWYDDEASRLCRRYMDPLSVRKANSRKLQKVGEEILRSVPGAGIASDQAYREADLAIDYREDVPALGPGAVAEICRIFRHHGAECKVSSIHINGWFGRYDKLAMIEIFLLERFEMEFSEWRENFLFCGDSPNDEPLFKAFPFSVGVRNILDFTDVMNHLPGFITEKTGGQGFAELVDCLLDHRKA